MALVEFSGWGPDRQRVGYEGEVIAKNCMPLLDGYTSLREFSSLGRGSLDDVCLGAYSGTTQTGTNFVVAGTDSKLFLAIAGVLTDVSKIGGYNVPSGGVWDFAVYGNRIMATNGVDPVQSYVVGTSSVFADLSADASLAKRIAVVGEFVVLGNIVGQGVNVDPVIPTSANGIHWSGIGDPTAWPQIGSLTAVTQQSDWQPLPNDGGRITALVSGSTYGTILRDREPWRMDYTGGPTVFQIDKIENDYGCIAINGAIDVGGLVYYTSENGFRVSNGQQSVSIGDETVDRYWLTMVDQNQIDLVSTAYLPEFKAILWYFPADSLGFIYSISQQRWSLLEKSYERVLSVMPLPASLDVAYLGYDMDAAASPGPGLGDVNLDSLVSADRRRFAVFTTAHELGDFQSDSFMVAQIVTGEYEPIPMRRAMVQRFRPVFKGDGAVVGSVTAKINPNGSQPASSFKVPNSTGWIPHRACGTYLQAQFVTSGEIEHFKGFDVILEDAGGR